MGIVFTGITAALGDPFVVKRVDIRIEGNTITTISDSPLPARPQDTCIDGNGKLAIPGFVNTHTHLPMVLFRGLADDLPLTQWLTEKLWPAEKRLTADDAYWGALLGLMEMIRSGTTACSDMYFHVDAIGKAVLESGMRAMLAYGIIASRLDKHGKSELARAEDAITAWNGAGDGRITTAVAPHAPYTCGKSVWQRAIALARRYSVPIHTHLAETRTEVADCYVRHRMSPVELLATWDVFSVPTIAAHCVHVTPSDIAVLAEHDVSVAHCPKSNAKLGSGIAPIARMRAAGVNVAVGTDGAASNNRLDMLSELRFAALTAKAVNEDSTLVPAVDAVRMATTAGAAAIRIPAGVIAVGNRADITIIDLSQVETVPVYDPLSSLVYAAGREAVCDVIVDGKFLMRDRALTTIDEDRVKYETKRIAANYKT